jgi:ElaB/YqjD/DUF883 family membrane-anchored ribosome-binding protein
MDQTKHQITPAGEGTGHLETAISPTGRSESGLESEIENARYETARSINEIKRRLTPAHIKEQARQATLGKAEEMARNTGNRVRRWGSSMIESFKSNPIPMALVGSGLAWMISSRMREGYTEYEGSCARSERGERHPDLHYGYWEDFESPERHSPQGWSRSGVEGETTESAGGGDAGSRAGEVLQKASEMGQRIGERTSQVSSQLRETASSLSHAAQEQGRRVRHTSRKAREGFFQQLEENPLAIAGIAMGVGAVMGLAIPESREERERIGPWRDKALDKVRDAGRETYEKIERVAEEATQAAKAEAERQDLLGKRTIQETEDKTRRAKEFGV